MTDKDTVSMATVKPDYAASEVYSTASEAPPLGFFNNFSNSSIQAYKRQANSVKIAKITAFTIIVSSFVLGSFILASSYLQAKASCDQVQALDSVLEKELMLETLQQVSKELPRAEALMGKESADDLDLQNIESKSQSKQTESRQAARNQPAEEESNDNAFSEEAEEMQKFPGKVPLELDLSDLAAALLQNNKKSRMNCVVERKHAEEIVDSPSKSVNLPFGMNLKTDPKKARITGERISIFCDGGDDSKEKDDSRNNREEDDDSEEEMEPMRPMFIPYQRLPIPFGPIPQQFPLTHMPQRMLPLPMQTHHHQQQAEQPIIRQLTPPFQHLPMRPPMPPQVMQAPRQEPHTVRIHVQQIPIREIRVSEELPIKFSELRPKSQQPEMPQFQVHRVPLGMALQHAGITADDLRNIQRIAENRITDELRRLAAEEAMDADNNSSSSNSSEEDDSTDSQNSSAQQSEQQQPQQSSQEAEQQQPQQPEQHEMPEPRVIHPQRLILQQLPEQPSDSMSPPPQQFGRFNFGRSLAEPVRIPVPMMQQQADMPQESQESSDGQQLRNPRSI